MGTLLLQLLILGSALSTLFRPWVGVVAYYILSILYPQIIWPWIFSGVRAAMLVSLATILAFLKVFSFSGFDMTSFKNRQNLFVLILWLSIVNSYLFNPYGNNDTRYIIYNTTYLFSTFNKIFLFYFISVYLIQTKKQYHIFITLLIGATLYFVYYSNTEYLKGHFFGRMAGPGRGGIYSDENVFSMLFVVALPFFYFMGNYYKNIFIKLGLWAAIPLSWHAVFLTGSLGGLIGVGTVMVFIAVRSKRKLFMAGIPIALVAAFISQGGGYLKDKAMGNEGDITQVGTAQTRFQSWSAGAGMLAAYPITGVGSGNFLRSYSNYSDTKPYVAHNTFIQLSAETGVTSGLMYLLIGWSVLVTYYKQRIYDNDDFDPFLLATKESITGGIIGFYVCATFLNLATYEIYYYLLVAKVVQDKLTLEFLETRNTNQSESAEVV